MTDEKHKYYILCGIPQDKFKFEYVEGDRHLAVLNRLIDTQRLMAKYRQMRVCPCSNEKGAITAILDKLNEGTPDEK